jgi:two-component system OmpR family sensor kinase
MDMFLNKTQKKTFILFLSLYIVSTYILLSTIAYFYYKSQKQYLHVQTHFNLHEKANELASRLDSIRIIDIGNNNYSNNEFQVDFLNHKGDIFGDIKKSYPKKVLKSGSFDIQKACLVAKRINTIEKDLWGFAIVDKTLKDKENALIKEIAFIFILIGIVVSILGFLLSKLFLRPINNYIKEQNTFIKDINHELNTPITSLIMSSKQLDKTFDKKLVKSVVISTKQLYEIYKSLIEINFEVEDKKDKLDLKVIMQESIDYFNEILISKNITVIANLESTEYLANKDKIQRVFNNLISNAIKYSYPNSSIKIDLTQGIINIEDNGIGIKEEHQDKIFERGYQANEFTRGYGIGLDVIRRICYQYDIKISLESKANVKTIFTLDFN